MTAFETEPSVCLYAYFQRKPEFDFEYEIYDCSTMMIVEDGSFQFHIDDGETMLAREGSILYCPPGRALHRKALSAMTLHIIRFTQRTYDRTLYSITPRIQSNLLQMARYGILFDPSPYPILIHYCKDTLYSIYDQTAFYPDIHRIRQYMDANFNRALSNRELSRMMHCSEVSLISQFKDAVGTTPQQYLTQKRLQFAKQLLLTTNKSHKEIAFECGYSDPLYFSRLFSKHNGVSPTEFKRRFKL